MNFPMLGGPPIPMARLAPMPATGTDGGYPWVDGELLYAGDLNAAFADTGLATNVLYYGADPTGVADSAPAINAALAAGAPTYLPPGSYLVRSAINCGPGSVLFGAGRGVSNILVDQTFSPTDTGIIVLNGSEQLSPIVSDMSVVFAQPIDQTSRAAFQPLGIGTSGLGGTGVTYPPAIFGGTSNRAQVLRMRFDSAWYGIWSDHCAWIIDQIEMGALSVGLHLGQSRDIGMVSRVHFWSYGFNATNPIYYGVFRDGNTFAARIGETGGWEGSIEDFTSSSGSVYVTNSGTGFAATDLTVGDGGILDIEGGGLQITNLSVIGNPDNAGAAAVMVVGGGGSIVTNGFISSGSKPVVALSGGVLQLVGSQLGSNAHTPNYPVILQSGGQLIVQASNVEVGDVAWGAWTTPIIQITGGNGARLIGNTFGLSQSGSQPGITMPDNANSCVIGNNFNGWPFTTPVPVGTAALGFYGFNSNGFVALGRLGTPGQLNFARADDGFSRAWVGFTTDSTAVSLVNTSGTNPTVSLNAGQSYGHVSFQINTVEMARVDANGLGLSKVTAAAAAPGATFGKLALIAGTTAGTAKLVAYAGTSTTPVTIVDNIGAGF